MISHYFQFNIMQIIVVEDSFFDDKTDKAVGNGLKGPSFWLKYLTERQISYITYIWNLKKSTSELIYKAEVESQI